MPNQLIDTSFTLYLTSEGQKSAAMQALQRLEKSPLLLAAVFESQEEADSFLESVSRNLLFDVQHPFEHPLELSVPRVTHLAAARLASARDVCVAGGRKTADVRPSARG